MRIGDNVDEPDRNFHGDIDEVRTSGIRRTGPRLRATHRSMFDAALVVWGETIECP